MLCPSCKVELKMADRQGIEIDYCPQCRGVWLDRGELDKIIERSATFGGPGAPYEQQHVPAQSWGQAWDDDDDVRRGRYAGTRRRGWFGEIFDFD
jgi:uncharacterized protein